MNASPKQIPDQPALEHQSGTDGGTLPLLGTTVVAVEQALAAPIASAKLADAGARVIKVERPEGDFARGYDEAAGGIASYFAWANRGKESIALDLRDDDDRLVMDALLTEADVFIQNLAVGAIDRLGYGFAQLESRHPSLVVCDISGYGPDGPYATMKAYDLLVQAESGMLSVSGPPGPHGRIGVSIADIGTGTNAALAIMMALFRRQQTGTGAHLTTSLFENMADWMAVPLLHHDYLGKAPDRVGLAHPSIAPYGGFESSDGQIVLIAIQSDREWANLCTQVLGRDDLVEDQRVATNLARVENRELTDQAVSDVFAQLPAADLTAKLAEERIAFSVVNTVEQLSTHAQLRRLTSYHDQGTVELPHPGVRVDWELPTKIPALDEHGRSIRAELGF